ncbi:hypothetical protein HMPREF9707_01479 [Falseniella ignava CCUG 37419]|uniref:Uncharacterized protein n=2 Tax=Falseniella ignava TaxID=137730 RepID=K1LGI6_9LACT|nr:hypothetical protein HMPREF9707_01479 [Falseniella ignava CCUG 37419]
MSVFDASTTEIRRTISFYQTIEAKIDFLKNEKELISPRFYQNHSFTGTMLLSDENYQGGISPYYGTVAILTAENTMQKRIDRLTDRYVQFKDIPHIKVLPIDAPLSYEEVEQYTRISQIEQSIRQVEDKTEEDEDELTINDILGELYED